MTITKEQLDELEHEAYMAKCKAANAALRGIALSLEDSTRSRSAAVTLSLVAIARAALALDEACDRGVDVSVMAERLRAVRLAVTGRETP